LFGFLLFSAAQRSHQLAALRNDEQSIVKVLDRLVLPRSLSDGQINAIAAFLHNYSPQEVTIETLLGDDETSRYAAFFYQALSKGGWTIEMKHVPSLNQVGVSIHFTQTMQHAQIPTDYSRLKADELLKLSLASAGVPIDGSHGRGQGIAVEKDLLKLTVGVRRRGIVPL
jgi:hypothetical protein